MQPEGPIAPEIKQGDRALLDTSTVLLRVSGVVGVGTAGTPGPQERLCFVLGTTGRHDETPGGGMELRRRWLSGYCIRPSIRRHWFKYSCGGQSLQRAL